MAIFPEVTEMENEETDYESSLKKSQSFENYLIKNEPEKQEFFTFIKMLLERLYQPWYSSKTAPIYSCLKHPFSEQYQFQQIPKQTIKFLKQEEGLGLTKKKLTQLCYFITPKDKIFESKNQMEVFGSQTIRIRSFFIVLLNKIVESSPIYLLESETQKEKFFLEWVKNKETKKLQISNLGNLQYLINDCAQFWNSFTEEQIFKDKLEHFSQMLTLKNPNKNYLQNLYKKVFVNNQILTWRDLLMEKPIFNSISSFAQRMSLRRSNFLQKEQYIDKMNQKRSSLKAAFTYLHKYFVKRDILEKGLKAKEEQQKYAKSLNFQFYLPKKLGLSLEATLDYEEWFEIFYAQNDDERQKEVIDAALKLQIIIECQSVKMLRIKGMQFYHLKRIMGLLAEKLSNSNPVSLSTQIINCFDCILKRQKMANIQMSWPYEIILLELKSLVENESSKSKGAFNAQNIENFFIENYKTKDLRNILPLMIAHAKVRWEKENKKDQILLNKNEDSILLNQIMKKMTQYFGITSKVILEDLDKIKGNSKIESKFITALKKLFSEQ